MSFRYSICSLIISLSSFYLHAEEIVETREYISQRTVDLARQNNAFAFNLYRNLNDVKGNLCFSPYSISSALVMVYNGAKEETETEMGEVLRFTASKGSVNEAFSVLNRYFSRASKEGLKDFRLDIANSLWIQTGVQVLPEFIDELGKYFRTSLRRVDFFKQREIARQEINGYVKEKTMGKITNLLQPDEITQFTKMVLISAIYLKNRWQTPFEPSSTSNEPFFVAYGKTVLAQTMKATLSLLYTQTEDFSAIELPYFRPKEHLPDCRFLILLPNANHSLDEIENRMNGEILRDLIARLERQEISLFLPKFSFTKSFRLKDVLIKMGMPSAFSANANFEGINGAKDLQIGQVAHKAFIEVDENGTEAAAATAVTMNLKAIYQPKEPMVFKVDHPFMFVIYEKASQSILFLGRVANPLESF